MENFKRVTVKAKGHHMHGVTIFADRIKVTDGILMECFCQNMLVAIVYRDNDNEVAVMDVPQESAREVVMSDFFSQVTA
jgi:hypothetical protein